jgi:hypothetical protein
MEERGNFKNMGILCICNGKPFDKHTFNSCIHFNIGIFETWVNKYGQPRFLRSFDWDDKENIPRITRIIEQQIMPLLDFASTDQGIDRILNDENLYPIATLDSSDPKNLVEDNIRSFGGPERALVSAWLVGNQKFDEIEERARQRKKITQQDLDRLDEIVKYLCDHVKRDLPLT